MHSPAAKLIPGGMIFYGSVDKPTSMTLRTVFIGLMLFTFFPLLAQNDTLSPIKVDTLAIRDTTVATSTETTTAIKEPVYQIKPGVDIPLTAVTAGWSLYAFTQIYSKDPSSQEQILNLRESDINSFDRGAVRPFSESLDRVSYYTFFGVMPMPFIFLTGKKTSKDFFKLTFLYLEAMSITGFLYTGSVYLTDRYRPYAYSSESTMDQRTRGGAKNSFYAGHVALVATSTFFGAKVHADYNPNSKIKGLLYGLAGAATLTTAYLRYSAGQHFPSDLILGTIQGTLTGILVPHFHKKKILKNPNMSLRPYTNGYSNGLAFTYKL
jgi:membrane-associated phospholipid phosphatase